MPDDLVSLLGSIDPALLGRRIRQLRVAAELTQGQLAGDRVSIAYVSRIESGQRRPELAVLEALAAQLRTTATALLTGAPDPTIDRIRVLLDHADLALRGGAPADATRILEQVRADVEASAPQELRHRWRLLTALTAEATGDLDGAIMALEDLVAEAPTAAGATGWAIALSRCYRESGDLARAISSGELALDSLRERGLDGSDEAVQLTVTVAMAHFAQGDLAHAARICRRAVARAEEMGTPVAMASAYWNASIMEYERGAPATAVSLAEKALALLDAAESNRNLARLRGQLGLYQLRLDPPQVEAARANFETAARELEWSSASPVDRGRITVALARAKLLDGASAEAYADVERVHAELADSAPLLAASALVVMGQAAHHDGDGAAAANHYRAAVATLSALGLDRAAGEYWFELGGLLDELGLEREAHHAYRSAAASTGMFSMVGLAQRLSTSG